MAFKCFFSGLNIWLIFLKTYWKLDFLKCWLNKSYVITPHSQEVFSIPVLHCRDIRAAHTPLHAPQTGSINNAESALCFISLPPTVYASGELKPCAAEGSSISPPANNHTGAHHRAWLQPIRTKPPSGSHSNYLNTNWNFKLLLDIISVSHQSSSAAGWKSSQLCLCVSPLWRISDCF